MPALSFGRGWLDDLLESSKQHTSRPETDRIKVGDVVNVYIEQRRRIVDKPLRVATNAGRTLIRQKIIDGTYPKPDVGVTDRMRRADLNHYYAHFLGKVLVTDVYDIYPCEMSGEELEAWAWLDGFNNFDPSVITPEFICLPADSIELGANWWFSNRYGNDWMQRTWTGIGWHGWLERYFSAGELRIVEGDV